tara:strand:+ start:175 stop:444 length:270 start_codon:yes stop_codon:yes gene_type:complete
MENKSSKHGYQKKIITKYGEITKLFEEKLIKEVPIKIDIKYAPESPMYNFPEIFKINKNNKTKIKFLKNSKSSKINIFRDTKITKVIIV